MNLSFTHLEDADIRQILVDGDDIGLAYEESMIGDQGMVDITHNPDGEPRHVATVPHTADDIVAAVTNWLDAVTLDTVLPINLVDGDDVIEVGNEGPWRYTVVRTRNGASKMRYRTDAEGEHSESYIWLDEQWVLHGVSRSPGVHERWVNGELVDSTNIADGLRLRYDLDGNPIGRTDFEGEAA